MTPKGWGKTEGPTSHAIAMTGREPCKKCGGHMRPGIALAQTYTGIGDFSDRDDVVTLSPGGPGEVIHCWKCSTCGWSVAK